MKKYHIKENKRILDSNLLIFWWNLGSRTLDFNGTARDYLRREDVKITFKYAKESEFDKLIIKVKFSIGNLNNVTFTSGSLEDVIRMAINIRLTYLGDRASFTFLGRTKKQNFR